MPLRTRSTTWGSREMSRVSKVLGSVGAVIGLSVLAFVSCLSGTADAATTPPPAYDSPPSTSGLPLVSAARPDVITRVGRGGAAKFGVCAYADASNVASASASASATILRELGRDRGSKRAIWARGAG